MKRILLAVAVLMVLGSGLALAANPEPFNVKITIRQAITIAKVTDLNFGGVDTGAATYTVNANAGPHTAGTGATAASFTVQGENGQTANVSFGANPVTISNGATNLSVTMTQQSPTLLFTGAAQTFYVGGAVTLVGTETTGLYTGSATLAMVYQ